jgi:hypothetical protein
MQTVDLTRLGLATYRPRRQKAKRLALWGGFASATLGLFASGALAGRYWARRA